MNNEDIEDKNKDKEDALSLLKNLENSHEELRKTLEKTKISLCSVKKDFNLSLMNFEKTLEDLEQELKDIEKRKDLK